MVDTKKNPPFTLHYLKDCVRGILAATALFSSLIVVNLLQTASLILLPFSRNWFRQFNRACANTWWGLCVLASERVAKVDIVVTGDEIPEKENAIVVANHQQMPDIVVLMSLARRKQRLGDMKWFVKDILKYCPGVGWGMLFLDCLFIKRNWDADQSMIQRTFSKIRRGHIPLWLISFSEGTRITTEKLEKSRAYARRAGVKPPDHLLIPRTKGFVASIQGLDGHIEAVYDVTIGYPDGIPTLPQYFAGLVKQVHLQVRRFAIEELPRDATGLSDWLMRRFEEKDRALDMLLREGHFPVFGH